MTTPRRPHRLLRALCWAGAATALAAVFLAYLRPELALTLATQVWACF